MSASILSLLMDWISDTAAYELLLSTLLWYVEVDIQTANSVVLVSEQGHTRVSEDQEFIVL